MRSPTSAGAPTERDRARRWGVLTAGLLAQASAAAVLQGLPGLAPLLRATHGLDYRGLGLVLSGGLIGLFAASVGWGLVVDRWGERWSMTVGLLLCAGAMVGAATAPSVGPLVAWLIAAGATGASVNAASGRLVITWFPPRTRGTAMGIRQTAIPVGAGIATLGLPPIGVSFGLPAALSTISLACVVSAAVVAVVVRDAPDPQQRPAAEPAGRGGPRVAGGSGTARFAAVSALLVVPQLTVVGFLVVYMSDRHAVSPVAATVTLAIVQFLGGATRIAVGAWSDRWGRRVAPLLVISVLVAVGFGVAAFADALGLGGGSAVLVAVGVAAVCWNGLAFTAVGERADPRRTGLALAVQNTAVAGGMALTPPLFGWILGLTSWAMAFAAVAATTTVAALLLLRPNREERSLSDHTPAPDPVLRARDEAVKPGDKR